MGLFSVVMALEHGITQVDADLRFQVLILAMLEF